MALHRFGQPDPGARIRAPKEFFNFICNFLRAIAVLLYVGWIRMTSCPTWTCFKRVRHRVRDHHLCVG